MPRFASFMMKDSPNRVTHIIVSSCSEFVLEPAIWGLWKNICLSPPDVDSLLFTDGMACPQPTARFSYLERTAGMCWNFESCLDEDLFGLLCGFFRSTCSYDIRGREQVVMVGDLAFKQQFSDGKNKFYRTPIYHSMSFPSHKIFMNLSCSYTPCTSILLA